jgi:Glycosyl transferase family 2
MLVTFRFFANEIFCTEHASRYAPAVNRGADTADVTVVIPALNRAESLAKALRSVHQQSTRPAEVIVVDDGSTDQTARVARELGARVIRSETSEGAAAARNRGVRAARTEFIAFLDSDDSWTADHLTRSLIGLEDHVFVSSPMVDSFGRGRGNVSGKTVPIGYESLFFPENVVCTSTVVARRQDIVDVGAFRHFDRAEDLDLWVRLLSRGTAAALAEPGGTYFVTSTYVPPELAERNTRGTLSVMSRYRSEPWMTKRLVGLILTQQRWDRLRHSMKRNERGVPRSAAVLASSPWAAAGLVGTFRHRRLARNFGGSPATPHSPATP